MDRRIDLTINGDFSNFNINRNEFSKATLRQTIFGNKKIPWSFNSKIKRFFDSFRAGNIYTGDVETIKNRKAFVEDFESHCECCGFKFSKIPWIKNEQGKFTLCKHCDSIISPNKNFWPGFKVNRNKWRDLVG